MKTNPTYFKIDTSYKAIVFLALPVMLANIAVPLQSMIDAAIVGNMGQTHFLAGLGIATQVMMLLLGSLNFLQASTTGLTAQALGKIKKQASHYNLVNAQHLQELSLILWRALLVAFILALVFILLKTSMIKTILPFFGAKNLVNHAATEYLNIRFFGFIAELANYALFGWFAGLGLTKLLLIQQLIISLSNMLLSCFLVYSMQLQIEGVALGTVIAQYIGLIFACIMAKKKLGTYQASYQQKKHQPNKHTPKTQTNNGVIHKDNYTKSKQDFLLRLFSQKQLKRLFQLNSNIFIRTLLLTASFAWITRLATQQGELFLAANVILLYILNVSAFALDGIAVSAKTLVGQSIANNPIQLKNNTNNKSPMHNQAFINSIKHTGVVNLYLAVGLTVLWLMIFPLFITSMTNLNSVMNLAHDYKNFACLLPLSGAAAYWLDGIFFGLTDGKRIRNAMIITTAIFFPSSLLLTHIYGNNGVWLAIHLFLWLRAFMLCGYLIKDYLYKIKAGLP